MPRPSFAVRDSSDGLAAVWASLRVCGCFVDMALSGLADRAPFAP
jgi:hypothetical protein